MGLAIHLAGADHRWHDHRLDRLGSPRCVCLLDGRKVHETGDVTFTDLDGGELDLDRTSPMTTARR